MEAYLVGFASLHVEAVHQEIVVVGPAARGERAGEAHVEQVDEVVVEVHVAVHAARELRHGFAVLHARDAAGADHLARELRRAAVVKLRGRFGDHGRKVGGAGERRGVHVAEYESEVALQPLAAERGAEVRQVELHLGIGRAAVGVVVLGIVLRPAADDLFENRVGRVVARGDDDLSDVEAHGVEGEVYLAECPALHAPRLGSVAHDRDFDAGGRVAGLEGVDALFVGGDADGRAREDDAGELQGQARGGVGDASAHAGALRDGLGRPESGRCKKDDSPACHTNKSSESAGIRRK